MIYGKRAKVIVGDAEKRDGAKRKPIGFEREDPHRSDAWQLASLSISLNKVMESVDIVYKPIAIY